MLNKAFEIVTANEKNRNGNSLKLKIQINSNETSNYEFIKSYHDFCLGELSLPDKMKRGNSMEKIQPLTKYESNHCVRPANTMPNPK